MYLRYQDIVNCAFEKKIGIRKESLFFSNDKFFYYTRAINFRKIFQTLVLKLDIIRPKLLQSTTLAIPWRDTQQERNKLEIMEKAAMMGEVLLRKNKNKLFKAKKLPNQNLSRYFHISCESKELFIREILLPLLKLVQRVDNNKWKWIESKKGFWRDLTENETMPVGGEVSLNLTTGQRMIKL